VARLFMDGFDKYGPVGAVTAGAPTLDSRLLLEWTSFTSGSTFAIIAGLSSTGTALRINAPGIISYLSKTITATARLIAGFRFSPDLLGGVNTCPIMIQAAKGATAQWTVMVTTSGTIQILTGAENGSAIATSTATVAAGSTHYLEVDVTVGAAGAYTVYLDGASLLTGTGNTRGDGSNNSADSIRLGNRGSSISGVFDDFYLFDTTGSACNTVLLTNPRIETQFPTSDSQTQFTFGTTTLGQAYSNTTTTNAPGANKLFLRSFTPAVSGTINSVACVPKATSAGANFKAVIYTDSGGVANTLLSSGTQVTGTTSGTTLTGALVTPQSITAGTPYWIGFITDTSVVLAQVDTGTTGSSATNTYGSGAPGSAPAMTTAQASWEIYGNVTGLASNYSAEALNPPVGDLSYAASATVNNEDLYGFPALSVVPNTIYTVAAKCYCEKTDAGARTMDIRVKSSGTDSGGSNTGLSPTTSYTWLTSYFDTDPATAAAWTYSGINAATSGPKVAT
jgi:hypothetical protein